MGLPYQKSIEMDKHGAEDKKGVMYSDKTKFKSIQIGRKVQGGSRVIVQRGD